MQLVVELAIVFEKLIKKSNLVKRLQFAKQRRHACI
jgi:hypothetical protein